MLTDHFSPAQLPPGFEGPVRVSPASAADARALLAAAGSAVADKTLARVLSAYLGVPVPANSDRPPLHPEDQLVLVEYHGPRLQPGQAHLPTEGQFDFYLIEIGAPDGWRHQA